MAALGSDAALRRAGRARRATSPAQNLAGAEAISEAASATFHGADDRRRNDSMVGARGRGADDLPAVPRSGDQRRAVLYRRGGEGGTAATARREYRAGAPDVS